MRRHKIIVRCLFGHHYRLHLPSETPVHRSIEPKDLRDKVSAHTFVWGLQVDDEQWLRILSAADYRPDRHLDRIERRKAVIALLVRGIINIYPLTHLKKLDQEDRYLNIDAPGGVQYHFIPSTVLVMRELPEVKFFNSEPKSATQFVEQLALTDEQLADAVRDLPLFFGLKSAKRTTRIAGLVHAMSDGKVAVVVEHPSMTPPRRKGPEDLPVEDYTPKPYTLGPHEESGYEPAASKPVTAIPTPPPVKNAGGNVSEIQAELAKLPPDILTTLQNKGVTIVAVKDSIVEHLTHLKGVRPRGWPKGKTWDIVPGAYDPASNTVVIATSGKNGHGSFNLALHETGHAYDAAQGKPSQSAIFEAAWNADKSSLGTYYTQSGIAGLSETYAEGFASYYGGDSNYVKKHPNLNLYWQNRK